MCRDSAILVSRDHLTSSCPAKKFPRLNRFTLWLEICIERLVELVCLGCIEASEIAVAVR